MNVELLMSSLAGSDFETSIVGPKGDEFHHIQSVDILQGEDDYGATSWMHIESSQFYTDGKASIKTPNRNRSMGSIVITFWSEEHYLWSRQLLFHKGMVYTSDTILQDNYSPDEAEQLSFNL